MQPWWPAKLTGKQPTGQSPHGASCGVQLREGHRTGAEEAAAQANMMAKHTVGALLALVREC